MTTNEMTYTEYQNEIAKVQEAFGMIAQASNVGVVVSEAMNIEFQLQGVH